MLFVAVGGCTFSLWWLLWFLWCTHAYRLKEKFPPEMKIQPSPAHPARRWEVGWGFVVCETFLLRFSTLRSTWGRLGLVLKIYWQQHKASSCTLSGVNPSPRSPAIAPWFGMIVDNNFSAGLDYAGNALQGHFMFNSSVSFKVLKQVPIC